jgi:hypothetical protein
LRRHFLKHQRGEAAPGEVISINMISLRGGVLEEPAAPFSAAKFIMNVQPAAAEAGFDMRLPPMSSTEMEAVERMMREEWAPAALNLSIAFTIQARAAVVNIAHVCCVRAWHGMAWTLTMMPGRPHARQAKRLQPDGSPSVTSTDAVSNPWWGAFTASMAAQGLAVAPEIFPAATDASYLRVKGIPSLGFSPMRCAP